MKFQLKITVPLGSSIPSWYGVAWRMYESSSVVCYIIPINKLVLFIRNVYLWLRYADIDMSTNIREVYHQGVVAGREQGYAKAEMEFNKEEEEDHLL